MSRPTISFNLPDHIYRAAEVQARVEGRSLEQWVSRIIAHNLYSDEATQEFFRVLRERATGRTLSELLDKVPARPPDPGDEL